MADGRYFVNLKMKIVIYPQWLKTLQNIVHGDARQIHPELLNNQIWLKVRHANVIVNKVVGEKILSNWQMAAILNSNNFYFNTYAVEFCITTDSAKLQKCPNDPFQNLSF